MLSLSTRLLPNYPLWARAGQFGQIWSLEILDQLKQIGPIVADILFSIGWKVGVATLYGAPALKP